MIGRLFNSRVPASTICSAAWGLSYIILSFASSRGNPATRRFYNVATILRMSASFKLVNGSHLSLSTLAWRICAGEIFSCKFALPTYGSPQIQLS